MIGTSVLAELRNRITGRDNFDRVCVSVGQLRELISDYDRSRYDVQWLRSELMLPTEALVLIVEMITGPRHLMISEHIDWEKSLWSRADDIARRAALR